MHSINNTPTNQPTNQHTTMGKKSAGKSLQDIKMEKHLKHTLHNKEKELEVAVAEKIAYRRMADELCEKVKEQAAQITKLETTVKLSLENQVLFVEAQKKVAEENKDKLTAKQWEVMHGDEIGRYNDKHNQMFSIFRWFMRALPKVVMSGEWAGTVGPQGVSEGNIPDSKYNAELVCRLCESIEQANDCASDYYLKLQAIQLSVSAGFTVRYRVNSKDKLNSLTPQITMGDGRSIRVGQGDYMDNLASRDGDLVWKFPTQVLCENYHTISNDDFPECYRREISLIMKKKRAFNTWMKNAKFTRTLLQIPDKTCDGRMRLWPVVHKIGQDPSLPENHRAGLFPDWADAEWTVG